MVFLPLALAAGAIVACAAERPTPLSITQRQNLTRYIQTDKFAEASEYAGYMSSDVVADPNAALNGLAQAVLDRGSFTADAFLHEAVVVLRQFELADTEDREHAFAAVEGLMDVLHIQSSNGRLNRAMNGFGG